MQDIDDSVGTADELEVIIAKAQQEAEDFGGKGKHGKPAKWLNPPRSCPDRSIDLVYTANPNHFFDLFHYWPEDDPRAG